MTHDSSFMYAKLKRYIYSNCFCFCPTPRDGPMEFLVLLLLLLNNITQIIQRRVLFAIDAIVRHTICIEFKNGADFTSRAFKATHFNPLLDCYTFEFQLVAIAISFDEKKKSKQKRVLCALVCVSTPNTQIVQLHWQLALLNPIPWNENILYWACIRMNENYNPFVYNFCVGLQYLSIHFLGCCSFFSA